MNGATKKEIAIATDKAASAARRRRTACPSGAAGDRGESPVGMNGATKKGDCNSDRQGRISGPAETDGMSVGSRGGSGEIPRRCRKAPQKRSRRIATPFFVVPAGIEPATHGFSVRCSTN